MNPNNHHSGEYDQYSQHDPDGNSADGDSDGYSTVIDQAVAATIRALLVVPHTSPAGAHGLRRITTGLGDAHGPDAVRDLAEALAADMAELLGAFAEAHHRDPLTVLDEWTHDPPPCPAVPADQQRP